MHKIGDVLVVQRQNGGGAPFPETWVHSCLVGITAGQEEFSVLKMSEPEKNQNWGPDPSQLLVNTGLLVHSANTSHGLSANPNFTFQFNSIQYDSF